MIRSPAVPSMRLKPLSSGCLVMSAGCGLVDHGSPPDSRGIEPLPVSGPVGFEGLAAASLTLMPAGPLPNSRRPGEFHGQCPSGRSARL